MRPSAKYKYLDHQGVLAFAHRGGDRVAPENTMAAFQNAVGQGYRYLETDVHASKDGVVYAHRRGLQVHVWTINDESTMHRLLDMGVDGVMTDDCALLKKVLLARNLW